MNRRTGFTLVEILIVVIILGILAAIVIPQFTEASNDARMSSMMSDLQTCRSQLELYKVQHLEKYPDKTPANTQDTVANFLLRLTGRTDQDGTINATGAYGPYLQKFPTNPYVPGAAGSAVTFGTTIPTTGDNSTGWYFITDGTGKFSANSSANGTSHTGL